MGLAAAVLIRLACPGAAAHADIFDCAAKAGHFMAFKMRQADKYIRIHNSPADFCRLYIFAALYRNIYVIRTLKAIANDNGTSYGQRGEPIFPGALQMLQGVFSAAGIHGVAVG